MVAPWMAWAVLLGLLAYAAALAVEYGLQLVQAPRRYCWALALAAVVWVPVLAASRRAPAPAAPDSSAASAMFASTLFETPTFMASPSPEESGWADGVTLDHALITLWALASTILGCRLAAGALLLRRRRRTWCATTLDGIPVLVSDNDGPAVLGALRPAIVIPRWVVQQPAERRLMILAHERQHLVARDPLLLTLAALAMVIAPWNPVLWFMRRQLRLAIEIDCDARL